MRILTEYYHTLSHWNRKLKGRPIRRKFLFNKFIELTSNAINRGFITWTTLDEDVVPQFSDIDNQVPNNPTVAVIVPVFIRNENDVKKLNNLIESLHNQTYKNFKAFFIDDCSPYAYSVPSEIEHIKSPENKGPATARNKGIEIALKSGAEIVSFTDSDCILDKDWISAIVTEFTQNRLTHAISGKTISYDKCWFGEYQNINGSLNGRKFRYSDYLIYAATCNFSVTRALIEQIRFNTAFPGSAAEDLEFSFQIVKGGYNIAFVENVIVYHDYGYNGKFLHDLPIFWKQYARYGKGEKRLIQLIPYYYDYLDTSDEIESVVTA